MKRVLSVLALAAVIALAITVVSTASQRPGKSAAGKTAHAASVTAAGSNADCPPGSCADPSQCPAMSGAKGATATHADMNGAGACPMSGASGCPSQCAPTTKGASTAVAVAEGK